MLINSGEYFETIEQIKQEIRAAQYKAALQVNRELILLYHSIGTVINEHKTWGNKFVDSLAKDINSECHRLLCPQLKIYGQICSGISRS